MGGFRGGMGGFHGGGFHGGFGHGFVGPGFHRFGGSPFFFHRNPFFFNNRFFFGNGFHSGTFFRFGLGFGAPWGWGWGGYPSYGGYYGSALYPYPAYGSPYDNTSSYAYSPSPNVTVIYPPGASDYGESNPPPESAPSAIINEYHWGASSNVQTPSQPVHFSIALRNNTVVDALAYWVDDGTLRYVDMQGKQQQVPLGQVDQARSQQLNRERGIEFGLPR
jgi:hypothetical protein